MSTLTNVCSQNAIHYWTSRHVMPGSVRRFPVGVTGGFCCTNVVEVVIKTDVTSSQLLSQGGIGRRREKKLEVGRDWSF